MPREDLTFARISMNENNHVVIQMLDNVEIEVKEIQHLSRFVKRLTAGKKRNILTDLGKSRITINHDAREFWVQDPGFNNLKLKEAFVVTSMANKILFNFIVKFHKPIVPVKVVETYEQAYDWFDGISSKSPLYKED